MGQRRRTAGPRTARLALLLGGAATMLLLLPLLLPLLPLRRAFEGGRRQGGEDVPSALLWTMMRSGSRMTQHLLAAHPCSFITEEPLRGRLAEGINASLDALQNLLACSISAHPDLVTQWINGSHLNVPYVHSTCRDYPRLCWDGALLDAVCRASCFRMVRVVAPGLSVAMALLQDHGSQAQVVHLVRDPRGVVSSRKSLVTGPYVMVVNNKKKKEFFHAEEMDLTILCQRYRHDLAVALHLARQNPDRYTLVRYEDLAQDPHKEVRRLYAVLGLPYTAQVDTKISEYMVAVHSTDLEQHPFSIKKKASSVSLAWRRRLPFSEVDRIQQECGDVLRAYGYRHYSRRQYEDAQDSPLLPLPQPWVASRHAHGGGDH